MEATCSVVLLLGPPASGKTTLGEKLARRFDYVLFDVGTHMRKHMHPEADADSFALHAVGQVLQNERKVILSGFPKWANGLDHLKSCRATIDMAILLSPVLFLRHGLGQSQRLKQSDIDTLSRRAAERHRKGERPEDDLMNFKMRLQTYEANVDGIMTELIKMGVKSFTINPMDTPKAVEEDAVFEWSIEMLMDPVQPSLDSTQSLAPNAAEVGYVDSSRSGEGGPSAESSRGRSTLPGSSKDAQKRRDPSEADIEVSLCLPSGFELLRPWLPARSKVSDLKTALLNAGETECDLELCYMGQILCDTDVINQLNDFFENGSTITVVRKEKPPPPPPRAEWDGNTHCTHGRCFTPDSVVRVLEGGVEVQRFFKQVTIGDMVRTGPGQGLNFFRRVQRVWKHPSSPLEEPLAAYELAPGCRITIGHPALVNGVWRRPESVCKDIASFENVVYQLEIEGHIDTVLVGSSEGVVCALLGCYCGEDFGWNIFTRKTVRCDKPCKKCAKACLPGLTFDHTRLTPKMLEARYEPY